MSSSSAVEKWGRAIGRGATELLFYLPIWLTVSQYALPDYHSLAWGMSLLIIYVIGAAVTQARSEMRTVTRWSISLLLASLFGAITVVLSQAITDYLGWIACILLGILSAERGAAMIRRGWTATFHSVHMSVGIMSYIICIPLSYWVLHDLAEWRLWIAACGIASIILFINVVNNRHLIGESVDGSQSKTLSEATKRNRLLLAGLTLLMAIFAAFRQIQQWLENTLLAAIKRLFGMIGSGEEPQAPSEQPSPPPQEMPLPTDTGEPSKFLVLLEQLLKIIVTIVIVIAVLILLYWLGRRLAVLMRKWLDKLLQRQSVIKADDNAYTDEVEKLMSLTKWRDQLKNRFRNQQSRAGDNEPAWEALQSRSERMRWLYRKWLRVGIQQGYSPQAYLTPLETAQTMNELRRSEGEHKKALHFASGYDAVRYGGESPSEDELEQYRRYVEQQSAASKSKPSKRK
ncbi:DUF4129 domain-containing protein [Paenibacillus sp. strain BS8-2]